MADIYPNNIEILKMFGEISFSCKDLRISIKRFDDLYNNAKKVFVEDNNDFFISSLPKSIYICNIRNENKKYTIDELNYILKSFLYSVSSNLLSFYEEMENKNVIIIGNKKKSNGHTGFLSINDSQNYICINKLSNLNDLKILVHEIGYAYYNYLNRIIFLDSRKLNNLIKSEVPSIWLELLFTIYLRNYSVNNIKIPNTSNFDILMYNYAEYAVSRMKIDREDENLDNLYKDIYEKDYKLLIKR